VISGEHSASRDLSTKSTSRQRNRFEDEKDDEYEDDENG
jgi:hypothetical protein